MNERPFSPGPDAPASSAPVLGTEPADPAADLVTRQRIAFCCHRVDFRSTCSDPLETCSESWGVTPLGVLRSLRSLREENAQGREILVRPTWADHVRLLRGVTAAAIEAAERQGFEPALVVEVPGVGHEVWMRGGRNLEEKAQQLLDAELERIFRPSRPIEDRAWGHLVGFLLPADGARPAAPVVLVQSRGEVYSAFDRLARACQGRAEARRAERRIEYEMLCVARGPCLPPSPWDRRAATVEALPGLLQAADRAAERLGVAAPARPVSPAEVDSWQKRLAAELAGFRALEGAPAGEPEAGQHGAAARAATAALAAVDRYQMWTILRRSVAERLGLADLPESLPAATAHALAAWRSRLAAAEERWDRQQAEEVWVASGRWRQMEAELRSTRDEGVALAREHHLTLAPSRRPATGAELAALEGWLGEREEPALLAARSVDRRTGQGLAAAVADAGRDPHGAAAGERFGEAWRERVEARAALADKSAAMVQRERLAAHEVERLSLDLAAMEARLPGAPGPGAHAAWDHLLVRLGEAEEHHAAARAERLELAAQVIAVDRAVAEHLLEREATRPVLDRLAALAVAAAALPRHPAEPAGSRSSGPGATAPAAGGPALVDRLNQRRLDLAGAWEQAAARPSRAAVAEVAAAADDVARFRLELERAQVHDQLRTAQRELRDAAVAVAAAQAEPTGLSQLPARVHAWQQALARHHRAETAWALQLDAAQPPPRSRAEDLAQALARVAQGDLTPPTLARLHRSVALLSRPAGGFATPAVPLDISPLTRDSAGADADKGVAAWVAARTELLREVRGRLAARPELAPLARAGAERTPAPAQAGPAGPSVAGASGAIDLSDLPRLGQAVGRFQAAAMAAERGRHQDWPRGGKKQWLVEPRTYLDHPAFAGRPQRALALWALHQAAGRAQPRDIAEALARLGASQVAAPRLLSAEFGDQVGRLAADFCRELFAGLGAGR